MIDATETRKNLINAVEEAIAYIVRNYTREQAGELVGRLCDDMRGFRDLIMPEDRAAAGLRLVAALAEAVEFTAGREGANVGRWAAALAEYVAPKSAGVEAARRAMPRRRSKGAIREAGMWKRKNLRRMRGLIEAAPAHTMTSATFDCWPRRVQRALALRYPAPVARMLAAAAARGGMRAGV